MCDYAMLCRCLITEDKAVIESKGFDSYQTDCCTNIAFATNWGDSDAILPIGVHLGMGARRLGHH